MDAPSKSNQRVVASIEARMGSSRLPGKVLADIFGQPVIQYLVNRLRRCTLLDDVIVATTDEKSDDPLADWCASNNVLCHRGSEDDVLGRVVAAQQSADADIVVEITGDCPLTDPDIVDLGIATFFANEADIVTNCGTVLTWPMGIYVQVFPLVLLEEVASSVEDQRVREHVSLYFYQHPERYRIINLIAPRRWQEPTWRLQIDYPEDLQFQKEIFSRLVPEFGETFGLEEVMALLRQEPDLVDINIHCEENLV